MIYESKVIVRYAETDQMGIAHHSVYPIWYEVARTEFIRVLGVSYKELEKMGAMLPVLELHCRYNAPAKYEDELTIRVRIKSMGVAKIEFEYFVYHKDSLLHIGTTLHGWVDSNSFRPLNLKKKFPEIYHRLVNAAEKE